MDKKFITVTGPLPQEMAHLRPPLRLSEHRQAHADGKAPGGVHLPVTDAHLNELMAAIGDSLVQQGLMTPVKAGLLGKKQGYLPTREAINAVVDLVRGGAAGGGGGHRGRGRPSDPPGAGKCLKPYFSAFEQKEMRDKLQAISQTPAGKAVRDMVEYVENLIAVMTLLVTVFT